jgi:hypothetical protein
MPGPAARPILSGGRTAGALMTSAPLPAPGRYCSSCRHQRARDIRDPPGQIAYPRQQHLRLHIEIDSVADDLDASPAHHMVRRLLSPPGVNQMPAPQSERRAVGQQLVQVRIRVPARRW